MRRLTRADDFLEYLIRFIEFKEQCILLVMLLSFRTIHFQKNMMLFTSYHFLLVGSTFLLFSPEPFKTVAHPGFGFGGVSGLGADPHEPRAPICFLKRR